jgi:hypothetical protein
MMELRKILGPALVGWLAGGLALCALPVARASDLTDPDAVADPAAIAAPDWPAGAAAVDMRGGGALQEFQYHRTGYGGLHPLGSHAPHPTIAPPGGWYGYGFPVQTYRWGWFGASRYYPRVVWHRGYYDDCCRWAYRHGY